MLLPFRFPLSVPGMDLTSERRDIWEVTVMVPNESYDVKKPSFQVQLEDGSNSNTIPNSNTNH